jgi:hypothetical protein
VDPTRTAFGADLVTTLAKSTGAPGEIKTSLAGPGVIGVFFDPQTKSYMVTERLASPPAPQGPDNTVIIYAPDNTAVFDPKDADGSDASGLTYYKKTALNRTDVLALYEQAAAPSNIQLTYISYGLWTTELDSGPAGRFLEARSFTGGTLTPIGDMPRSGLATYAGIVDGFFGTGASLLRLGGSGNMNVDFGTGQIASMLTLTGNSDLRNKTGSNVDLGSVVGIGSMSGAGNQYSGSYTGRGAIVGTDGSFIGGFYGPGAAETGHSFRLTGPNSTVVTGVFVGKK